MRWKFPIYNQWGQLIKNLYVRCTQEVRNLTLAEYAAQNYLNKHHSECHIRYDEIEELLDEVQVQEVEL